MAEGNPHGMIPQLPALRRGQLVHSRAVLCHHQGGDCLFFYHFPYGFLSLFIPQTWPNVNVADGPQILAERSNASVLGSTRGEARVLPKPLGLHR
jgi:hypothetical protein